MKKRDENSSPLPRSYKARNEEAREKQMVALAVDLAEKQLREGTASSQVITHYLKLGSTTAKLEQKKAEKELELLGAKTEALQSQKRIEELYSQALSAMKSYGGMSPSSMVEDIIDEDI